VTMAMPSITDRIENALIPAVPIPFRGTDLDTGAQQTYAQWMAAQPVAGVAVWAHTGRGPHLSGEQRRQVLDTWREALPDRLIVAGARDIGMAIEARRGKADALLAFPQASDPVGHHQRLSRELPVIAFYLYQAAGGVAYDDRTLHGILELPNVIGIKVATLDSVMVFQRIAALMRDHPTKLLITGEDRFLGYSLLLGARAALIGMGAALPDLQADLLRARAAEDWHRFVTLSELCDRFAQATFIEPMEGYVRRMLWAAAADGALPPSACDDHWGPPLPPTEREVVEEVVRYARAARA
jgi:4-hydroxy-tetrahydrodipicolinate synthase